MSRRWFKRFTPSPEKVKEHRVLRVFGNTLFQPSLWRFNRESVARAMAIGLFWALVPMPFQMVPAAMFALRFRANVALSLALVWLTNPLTMPPVFYATWRLGCLLLGRPGAVEFHLTWHAISTNVYELGLPLYLGSLVTGLVLSATSFFGIQALWTWNAARRWRSRNGRRLPAPQMQR